MIRRYGIIVVGWVIFWCSIGYCLFDYAHGAPYRMTDATKDADSQQIIETTSDGWTLFIMPPVKGRDGLMHENHDWTNYQRWRKAGCNGGPCAPDPVK